MPFSTFNTGTDRSVTIIDNDTNAPVSLGGNKISLESEPKINEIESKPIDNGGLNINRDTYDGWTGTVEVDRAQGDGDALQALIESTYYTSGRQKYFTIAETTFNQEDGSVNEYHYTQATLKMQNSGRFQKDSKVSVTFKFHATQRVQIQ